MAKRRPSFEDQIAWWKENGWPEDQIRICQKTAHILGGASAAQRAIDNYDLRQAAGEQPICVLYKGVWVVIARAEPAPQTELPAAQPS